MTTPQPPDVNAPQPKGDALLNRVIPRLKRLRDPEQRGAHIDAAAHEALTLASMLFDALAGWARDHVIGRKVQGIPSAPYASGTKRERELGDDRPWDDCDLQRLGSEYKFDDPTLNKKIIVELTEATSRVLGQQLSFQLAEAFEGLLFGQQYELVRPCKSGMKGPSHELWNLRLKACQLVEFLRGTGCNKEKALELVADAYGLNHSERSAGPERLIKWEQRLVEHFDKFLVTDALETAFNLGTWYGHYKHSSELDEFEQEHFKELKDRYGEAALARDGRKFMESSPI